MTLSNNKPGCISFICNLIWFFTGGIITGLIWIIAGLILCITIIGIPFGKQCFKFAAISFAPFGKSVETNFGKHPIANIIWLILFGWEMFIGYIVSGLLLCVTIIGIPVGIQIFKFAILSLMPFGSTIR